MDDYNRLRWLGTLEPDIHNPPSWAEFEARGRLSLRARVTRLVIAITVVLLGLIAWWL